MFEALCKVIKYEGDNSTFIWKFPEEDFNSHTQLIVHDSQEAVFFMNGQALDTFGPGRHSLKTENLPIIGSFFNGLVGENPFHCEVYYINKSQVSIKWGTASPVTFLEPQYRFPIDLGLCGEMKLRVENGRKTLTKLVGTNDGLSAEEFKIHCKSLVITRLKSYVGSMLKDGTINVFNIDSELDTLSAGLKARLKPDFEDYGIRIDNFLVVNVRKPENNEKFQKYSEVLSQGLEEAFVAGQNRISLQRTEAEVSQRVLREQGEQQIRDMQGISIKDEWNYDITKREIDNAVPAAKMMSDVITKQTAAMANSRNASLTTLGGLTNSMNSFLANSVAPRGAYQRNANMQFSAGQQTPQTKLKCPQCNADVPQGSKFCMNCGHRMQQETIPDGMTKCRHCGKIVHKGKFCEECGKKLSSECPVCHQPLSENARFCMNCGTAINN